MSVKNIDGSEFKIQSVNPLVKNQTMWKNTDLVLYNLTWNSEIVKPEEKFSVNSKEESIKDIKPEKTEIKNALKKEVKRNYVIMWCLPMQAVDKKDDFYGEEYKKMIYGEKIAIESVIIDTNQLNMIFWTTVRLEKESILYPSKYSSGERVGDYTWWKISSFEDKNDGFIYHTVLSDIQPSFSD